MLWQSVALARPGSTVNVLSDLAHAALHWQQEGHHHHDDGSFHLDDSPASAFHLLGDHLTVTTALLPSQQNVDESLPVVVSGRAPWRTDIEARGVTVSLRSIPLLYEWRACAGVMKPSRTSSSTFCGSRSSGLP